MIVTSPPVDRHHPLTMAAAPRVRPEDFFSAAQWQALSARSRWRGLWLVAHCWGVIALAMAMGALWPVTIPLAVVLIGTRQLVTRIRNIAEHALVGVNQADPLRQARTTRAGWVERALLAPYWVNFHNEHHLFTQLPCWQLPRAHALLQAAGTTQRMEVQPGYLRVLQLATAA